MNVIERVLQERYDELGLAQLGMGREMGTVLLTPRFVTSRHVVGLVFPKGRPAPCVVVKLPRRPGDNAGVQREVDMLRAVAELTSDAPLGVPRVLGSFDVGAHTVLVETAMTGAPLDPKAVCANPSRAVHVGARFTAELPVTRDARDNIGCYEDAIAAPLRSLERHLPLAGRTAELVARTHEVLQPLRRAALPAVFEHADLSHPNIFVSTDGALQVVDWERSTMHGLPGQDLTFFLQYVSESERAAYTRPAQLRAFDDAFLSRRGWARPTLLGHLANRGVSETLLPQLIVAAWARSAATLTSRLMPEVQDATSVASAHAPSAAQLEAAVTQDRDFWLWRHALDRAPDLQ